MDWLRFPSELTLGVAESDFSKGTGDEEQENPGRKFSGSGLEGDLRGCA